MCTPFRLSTAFLTIALLSLTAGTASASPSYNCDRWNLNQAERTICKSWRLSRLDRSMSRHYFEVAGQLGPSARWKLRNMQRNWLAARNECGDLRYCIGKLYRQRIAQLKEFEWCFDHTAKPGCVWRTIDRHADAIPH